MKNQRLVSRARDQHADRFAGWTEWSTSLATKPVRGRLTATGAGVNAKAHLSSTTVSAASAFATVGPIGRMQCQGVHQPPFVARYRHMTWTYGGRRSVLHPACIWYGSLSPMIFLHSPHTRCAGVGAVEAAAIPPGKTPRDSPEGRPIRAPAPSAACASATTTSILCDTFPWRCASRVTSRARPRG